ncbi:DegV family EDD domain-containing protein [bacterium 3DAC]|nr:DegV family EDD domain-containing protein [bacterium 3DAC]
MLSIVVDGTADVPPHLKDVITTVPLYVVFRGKSHKATEELLSGEIEHMLVPGEISTSMPTAYDFMEVFRALPKPILVVHVSKNISGTYRAIYAAIDELGYEQEVIPFDTLTAGTGIGLYAWLAHELDKNGKSIEEIISILTEIRDNRKEHTYAVVGDVRFTLSGGRVSGLAGMAARAMRIMITISPDETGTLKVIGKSFGRKKALRLLRKHMAEAIESAKKPLVGISHAWCDEDAHLLKDYLHALRPDAKFFLTTINATLIAHGGKGTIAASVLDAYPYL